MSKQIEAMKLVLKDLERSESKLHKARAALREALMSGADGAEQPAQRPTNCRHCGGADNVICAGQCKEQPAQPLTDEMVTAAARALNKRQAEACGVDKNDHWTFYGDDIKEDARALLEAALGITGESK